MYDDDVLHLLELYHFYKDGYLYTYGGISEQPFWYVDAMMQLKMETEKWQEELKQ